MAMENQKVALVTGATGVIGKAIARQIADKQYRVVIVARNQKKAEQTVAEIISKTGNQKVEFVLVDLSRQLEIIDLAANWQGPLHVLVNNAAVTPPSRQETPEGIELQFATNVLGYFWMTQAYAGILRDSAPSRIVDVASYWAGGLDLTDLEFKHRGYRNGAAYRQSKQANRMLTAAWAKRLEDGVTINACHPGDVNSTLSNNLGFGCSQSPKEGAETPVWLATRPIENPVTGKYFEYCKEVRCRFGENMGDAEKLFKICQEFSIH